MTDAILELAVKAARRGGDAIQVVQSRPRTITSKGFRDEVTDADYAAQDAIIAAIREEHTDQLIASEENDIAVGEDDWEAPTDTWWLIDPLDGTTNFSRNVPHYCVSVAALQGRTLIAGAVYDPCRDHMFAAGRGMGTTLNGKPVKPSDRDDITEAMLDIGLARGREKRRLSLEIYTTMATECRSVRSMGSAALAMAYVAAGWLDAYIHLTLSPWDLAAAGLMVQEAGGRLIQPSGEEWKARHPAVLASNALLSEPLLALTQDILRRA